MADKIDSLKEVLEHLKNRDRDIISKRELEDLGYKINNRSFESLNEQFFTKGSYRDLVFGYGSDVESVLYWGAEYKSLPKPPHITVMPHFNLYFGNLMSTSVGHDHVQLEKHGDGRRFQEIYEFLGHGGLLVRNSEGARLYFLRPGEKAVVGTDENMTILSFSDEDSESRLVTLDYSNPNMNDAKKDTENNIGSLMYGRFTPGVNGLDFYINDEYRKRGFIGGRESVVHLDCCLGEDLFDYVGNNPDCFDGSGISPVLGGNVPKDLKEEFDKPLVDLVLEQNEVLFEILGMDIY